MPQFAVCYAPTATAQPGNTQKTGSFYIGNMSTRKWDVTVSQTSDGNTYFFASPLTSSNYIMAIPNPNKPAPFTGVTQPQFFRSTTISDATFISMCDYVLKNYDGTGAVNPGAPQNPAGCNSVATCTAAFNTAGWFQNYSYIAPA